MASDPSDPVTPQKGRMEFRAKPVPPQKGALKKEVVERAQAKKKECQGKTGAKGQSAQKKAALSKVVRKKKKVGAKASEKKTKKGASGKQKTKEKEEALIHPQLGRLYKTVSKKYKKAYFTFPSPSSKSKRHLVTVDLTEDFEASPPPQSSVHTEHWTALGCLHLPTCVD